MKVFATTAIQDTMPHVSTYVPFMTRLAEQDRFGTHRLVDDAGEADIILFLDAHQHYLDLEMKAIRQHPLVLKHREKSFVYNEQDQPWCAMPGLYAGMPTTSFDPQRQRACAYLSTPNSHATALPVETGTDLLFSFMGRGGNRVRERIQRLKHPRACIIDTSAIDFFGDPTEEAGKKKSQYVEVMGRSKFVLCPAGAGPASFRIFETLSAGRVPVILSDLWVPPSGPAWKDCAVFVKERDVDKIGGILEKEEERFPRMARAAREEMERWFAPDVLFHRMTESIKEIMETRAAPESVLSRRFNARHLRLRARAAIGKLKSYPASLARARSGRLSWRSQ